MPPLYLAISQAYSHSSFPPSPLPFQAGRVFSGFSEGEIAFPPSFRWRRGAVAGDFTDRERLAASYVLQKKGDGQVRREGGREGGKEKGRGKWTRGFRRSLTLPFFPPSLPPSLPTSLPSWWIITSLVPSLEPSGRFSVSAPMLPCHERGGWR